MLIIILRNATFKIAIQFKRQAQNKKKRIIIIIQLIYSTITHSLQGFPLLYFYFELNKMICDAATVDYSHHLQR